jgi:hypothetical protein
VWVNSHFEGFGETNKSLKRKDAKKAKKRVVRKRYSKGKSHSDAGMTLTGELGTSWAQIYFGESGVLGSIPGLPMTSWAPRLSSKGRTLAKPENKKKPIEGKKTVGENKSFQSQQVTLGYPPQEGE